MDHTGSVSFLRPDIPLYTTALTALISKAIQDSGPSDIEREMAYAVPRESKDGVLQTMRGAPLQQRPLRVLSGPLSLEAERFWHESPQARRDMAATPVEAAGETIGAGNALRWFPVDHSIYGAAAFAVETAAGWGGDTPATCACTVCMARRHKRRWRRWRRSSRRSCSVKGRAERKVLPHPNKMSTKLQPR